MPSKLVIDRKKSGEAVANSAKTNADKIGEKLNQRFASLPPSGATPTDYCAVIRDTGLLVASVLAAAVAADEANELEGLDDAAPQAKRDETRDLLHGKLIDLRRSLSGLFGEETAVALGLSGTLPLDPQALSALAGALVKAASTFSLPPPNLEGVSFDLVAVAAPIGKLRLQLEGHLADVAREVREGQQTLAEKNRALEAYDATFGAVATMLTGMYRLADEPELANKVRPSTRRPGQTELPPEPTPESTPDTPQ